MKKSIAGLTVALFLMASQTAPAAAAAEKGRCLTCHTNDAVMKALYKPPAMVGGEAEG